MDGEVTSGIAAIMGAVVGGLASLTSTWVGERGRHRRDLLQREITKREVAYSDFIDCASKVYVASATHHIDDDDAEVERVVSLYAVASRIRLFASEQVIRRRRRSLTEYSCSTGQTTYPPNNYGRVRSKRETIP